MDSIRTAYGQVALVDNGGFFPEMDTHQDVAWFMMDAMKLLNVEAVGIGDRDLRFGLAYLKGQVKRTGLSVTSANLIEKRTKKPAFAPYVVKKIGNVKVGFFSLLSTKSTLGPAKDSLLVEEPALAAGRMVKEMRAKGAEVVVLLSQLGKVESEDLVTAVDGIDAVIAGFNVPMLQKGRMVKKTVACYGGEQGQYLCRTELTLDAKRHVATGEAETVMLGPEVGEKPEFQRLVKSFEDGFNEKLRKAEMERLANQPQSPAKSANDPDHFLGADVCMRCHVSQGEQWKTTSHSLAWQTLVDAKKDATPECIPCHVVGFKQAGGFQNTSTTPGMTNVQCENCHGMGTQHEAFASSPRRITEQVCITCHQGENDPEFNWEKKLPKIAHGNMSGETIKAKKTGKGSSKMGGTSGH